MTSSGRLAAGPAPGESLVSALRCAPLRVGAAASSESSCGAEWGTQVTPMNVSSALASADTGSRAPSRGGGPRGAAGRGPGRGPGRSGCPRRARTDAHRRCSARVTCRFSENALRPDARQSRGGRSGPGRRPAPATPAPVGRLRGCGFSGRLGTDLLEAGARGGACARRGGAGPGASGSRGSSTTWWPRGGSASGGSLEWHWWQARGAGDVSCRPHPAISPLGIVPEQTLTYSE